MYQHILLAVALPPWEAFSAHALAAREVAVALAKGAGARLSVLSVYAYDDPTAETIPRPWRWRGRVTMKARSCARSRP
jgi:nucleotide-binding universal stress UspA family protein